MNLGDTTFLLSIIKIDPSLLTAWDSPDGKLYLVKWCDIKDGVDDWLTFEITSRTFEDYLAGNITLRDVEDTAINRYHNVGPNPGDYAVELKWLAPDEVPEGWLASEDSYYDEDL